MRTLEKRENKGYELQFFNEDGDYGHVVQCDNVGELAQVFARCCWGCNLIPIGVKNANSKLPVTYLNGKKWCFNEYSEVI